MKKAVILILLFIVLIGGVLYNKILEDRCEQERMSRDVYYLLEWAERLELLYSDETFEQLGDFFETIQADLEYFINHFYRDNLFEELSQVLIDFPLTEHEAMLNRSGNENEWHSLIIYNDEIVTETSAEHLVEFFESRHEFLNIIKDLGKYGVVLRISISNEEDRDLRVRFMINPAHTEFTERLVPSTRNSFIYITGIDPERILADSDDRRHIIGNWYMEIGPAHFNSERRPIPLED